MMKCRLFSALLLLFTLMAAGRSRQPAAATACQQRRKGAKECSDFVH